MVTVRMLTNNDIFKKQTEQKQWNNQNYCPISPDRRTPHLSARRWNVFRWHRSCIPKLLSTSLGGERGSWGRTILIFMLWVMMVCNEMFAPFQAFPTGDHADLREDPDWQDHHTECGNKWHYLCQGDDSGLKALELLSFTFVSRFPTFTRSLQCADARKRPWWFCGWDGEKDAYVTSTGL